MNKGELINEISKRANTSVNSSKKFLEVFIDVITDELKAGEKVKITGFGTFEAVESASREGRNPKTGESLKIESSVKPRFKAGKNFKDSLN